MKPTLSQNANPNYVCTVFQFKEYMRHPHINADKLEIVSYQGCPVIVQKGIFKDGDWLALFPTETHISKSFLSERNAFRHTALNSDPQATPGFFEDNCRVKAISLRSMISRGWIVPISLLRLSPNDVSDGMNFDTVDGKLLVKKYIVPIQGSKSESRLSRISRKRSEIARIVEDQFEFHYDTEMLAKNLDLLYPEDVIVLTNKWHGTSLITGKLLCYRKLSFFERIKKLFGKKVKLTEYRLIVSSRNKILTLQDAKDNEQEYANGSINNKLYFDASKILEPFLEENMTIYSEIVGYLPSGKEIQKGYDYKCEARRFKIMPYRVHKQDVLPNGCVGSRYKEFTVEDVQKWAKTVVEALQEGSPPSSNVVPIVIVYKGLAKDLYSDLQTGDLNRWRNEFLERLANDKNFYMNETSPDCNFSVPHEGLVLRFESKPHQRALKIKCDKFYEYESKQLDSMNEALE